MRYTVKTEKIALQFGGYLMRYNIMDGDRILASTLDPKFAYETTDFMNMEEAEKNEKS